MNRKLDQFKQLLTSISPDQKVNIQAFLAQWEKEDSRMDTAEAMIRLLYELAKE